MTDRPWNVGVPGTVFLRPRVAYHARMAPDRLSQQLAFLLEIDRLKQINRQTPSIPGTLPSWPAC